MENHAEKRAHRRFYEPTVPVEIFVPPDTDHVHAVGLLSDISLGGLRIVSEWKPAPGRRYTVCFALPGEKLPLKLAAQAVHSQPLGQKFAAGFQFEKIDTAERLILQSFLYQ